MGDGFQGAFDDITMFPADFLWGGRENAPIFGNRFDNKYEDDMKAALAQAEQDYAAYRPEIAQARTEGLNQALSLFSPANEQLGRMYGQGSMADLTMENPMADLFSSQSTEYVPQHVSGLQDVPQAPTRKG